MQKTVSNSPNPREGSPASTTVQWVRNHVKYQTQLKARKSAEISQIKESKIVQIGKFDIDTMKLMSSRMKTLDKVKRIQSRNHFDNRTLSTPMSPKTRKFFTISGVSDKIQNWAQDLQPISKPLEANMCTLTSE